MLFRRMFPVAATPVAVDIGASSVKLLQLSGGEVPAIIAAREIEIPEEARMNIDRRFAFFTETLPGVLKSSGFKGRRVVCSPSSSHFTIQQVEVQSDGPITVDDQVRGEIALRLGCPSSSVVARSFKMPNARGGSSERVCLAIAREDVMRHVELFKHCRMDLVGVHPDHTAMMLWIPTSPSSHGRRKYCDDVRGCRLGFCQGGPWPWIGSGVREDRTGRGSTHRSILC